MFHFTKRISLTLQNNPTYDNNDWNNTVFRTAKGQIRDFFCIRQRRRCIYCDTMLEVACNGDHIEHIIPKEFRPVWMFEPYNLAIACGQCNTQKNQQQTLKRRYWNLPTVPLGSRFYLIVHPHFDHYHEHIEWIDGLFVKARNDHKGHETVEMCGLWRPLYADRRARAIGVNIAGLHTMALLHIQIPGLKQREIDGYNIYINELIQIL
jgi:hypothetical protein